MFESQKFLVLVFVVLDRVQEGWVVSQVEMAFLQAGVAEVGALQDEKIVEQAGASVSRSVFLK